jgi:hypothetical protein
MLDVKLILRVSAALPGEIGPPVGAVNATTHVDVGPLVVTWLVPLDCPAKNA